MKNNDKRVLLISNSTLYGSGYLDFAETEIRSFLGNVQRVAYVPYALLNRDAYATSARERFQKMGFNLESIHTAPNPKQAIADADAIFIGGGNTFRLLNTLYDQDLLQTIRHRVNEGMLYIGASAGSNVAGPTIKTTNDMPIVEPPSFEALGLVPFQINPHYLDPTPGSTHMGETREERILQFLEENDTTVLGLREGAMVLLENGSYTLKGSGGARVFRKGQEPIEVNPNDNLTSLLDVGQP